MLHVQAGLAPHEALLLNSLRQLLSAAPAMESTIKTWCAAGQAERRRILPVPATSPKPPAMGARSSSQLPSSWLHLQSPSVLSVDLLFAVSSYMALQPFKSA